MKDVNELLVRAQHYREMSDQIMDQKARAALLELAAEYEKQAQRVGCQVPQNAASRLARD